MISRCFVFITSATDSKMHRYTVSVMNILGALNKRKNILYRFIGYIIPLRVYPLRRKIPNLVGYIRSINTVYNHRVRIIAYPLKHHDPAG